MRSLHINYRYLLNWAESVERAEPGSPILDYGCGSGQVVAEGRARGLEIYGAEVFYEGGNTKTQVEKLGLLGDVIREIRDGGLDFDDGYFHLVVANEVFEHIADFDPVLDEIWRVLKPGGKLLALFPSVGVIREGHIGIPIAHWLPPGQLRLGYTTLLRTCGLGKFRDTKTPRQWAIESLDWLDRYTFYRTKTSALEHFSRRFQVRLLEDDYISFRLNASPKLARLTPALRLPFALPAARILMRRLAGMVVLATKV